MSATHKSARAFVDALNDGNVRYCHFKSNAHVADAFTAVDDLDILVAQEDVQRLTEMAANAGYKRFVLPPQRAYIGVEDFLALDADIGRFSHLHLHFRLTLGEAHSKSYQLPFEDGVLSCRIFDADNAIYTTAHEDELWLLLVRAALKIRHRDTWRRKGLSASFLSEYAWLRERVDDNAFAQLARALFGETAANLMLGTDVRGLRKVIAPQMQLYRRYNPTNALIARWMREGFRVRQVLHNRLYSGARSYRRTPICGGRIVAFLGPDGAGKSSVIAEVVKAYARVMDTAQLYMGSGDGKSSMLRAPMRFIYKKLLKRGALDRKSRTVSADGGTKRQHENGKAAAIRKLGQVPWTFLLSSERANKLARAGRLRANGYLVITDRYPQTQILGLCDGPRVYVPGRAPDSMVAKAEKRSYDIADRLRPDLVVLLKVSPEVAFSRKRDEVDIGSHVNLMRLLTSLDFGAETQTIVINADQPLASVIADAMRAIWCAL